MSHRIYVVSSEWGGSKGGINTFNKTLVEAMARVVGKDVEVYSVSENVPVVTIALGSRLKFLTYDGDARSLAGAIERSLIGAPPSLKSIVIVGHDVHTGPHVLDARDFLRTKGVKCRGAVFCHMDYSAYQDLKGHSSDAVLKKAEEQRSIVRNADCVYAVGPLLRGAFERLRESDGGKAPIHEIIPGVSESLSAGAAPNPSQAFKFFFSGRMDPENDPIKNGRVALRAIHETYRRLQQSLDPRWRYPATANFYGLSKPSDEAWFFEGIDRSTLARHIKISVEGFTDQEKMFEQLRDSHIALMPSVHEGFGLAGWEAISAGIPMICSHQSGLAIFLEELFERDHHVPRESVLTVKLGSHQDVTALSEKIEELSRGFERRRTHAKNLATYLSESYSWEECARSVASALDLAPLGSPDWQIRRRKSKTAVAQREEGDEAAERYLKLAVQFAGEGKALTEWSVICTALSYLSGIGKKHNYTALDSARTQLNAIAVGIDAAYQTSVDNEPVLRCAGRFDVAWRFMAAASSIARSLTSFVEVIPGNMMSEIRNDNFLTRELLYYSTKYSAEFAGSSEEIATEFFSDVLSTSASDVSLQIRFARLEVAFPALSSVAQLNATDNPAYSTERKRCQQVKASDFDLNDVLMSGSELGPTALALSSIDRTLKGRGVDQLFEAWSEHGGELPETTWRGDKLLRTAVLSAAVHPKLLIALLEALAGDEEEALRWAAIDLAFSPILRGRLFRASRAGTIDLSPEELRARLGRAVDSALESGGFHPWMQREFLNRFHREHVDPVLPTAEERFTASDFPIGRQLFGPALGQGDTWSFDRLHPEVLRSSLKMREDLRRVLLVLPPISLDSDHRDASQTSTPPLGLGMIGSQLLSQGHDVHLADCHRAPGLVQAVLDDADRFEWVGFNVVLPTMRSTFAMCTELKKLGNPPIIVVGGPAVNARAFRNAAMSTDEKRCWDFEISAKAEENFVRLVADVPRRQVDLPIGVVPNELSALVIRAGYALVNESGLSGQSVFAWPEPVLLDRRIFSTPRGDYEPQRTRALDGTAVEAHVVMSRGCNWNCTFCTERLVESKGERRRSIASVTKELRELARKHSNLRLQFVDDNLFPQIAALPSSNRIKRAEALEWSEGLIEVLCDIRSKSQNAFGWRGIFRIEDFFAYEADISDFVGRLAGSGCRMLAFGIEHGNEEKRRKMKAGSATNAQFQDLFARLRHAEIHSKAYFIIGGPKETAESSEETIAFSIESGVSLAYFALYKEFVPALKSLQNENITGRDSHEKYSNYQQLRIRWDDVIAKAFKNPDDQAFRSLIEGIDPNAATVKAEELITVYNELSRLGFRFSDLVKYSDHHAQTSPASEVLSKVNFNDQELFEWTVASAYIRFYMRQSFVGTYKSLLEYGY